MPDPGTGDRPAASPVRASYKPAMRTILAASAAVALLAVATASPAQAADPDAPLVDFNAFGTAGLVYSSEDQADFVRTQKLARGAGASGRISAEVDSLLAAQLTVTPTPRLSAVVQAVAMHDHEGRFRPEVEWANVRVAVNDHLALRAGRIALPVFFHTETRRVGYVLPWVRTPLEVYELVPLTTNDGIDLTWQTPAGPGINTFQFAFGHSHARFANIRGAAVGKAETRDQFFLANTYETGNWTLRANYGQAHVIIDAFRPLFDAFRRFGPEGSAIADRYDVDGDLQRFMGASVSWDDGRWFALGEWGRFFSDNALSGREGWYVTGGRRFGTLTPYATVGGISPHGTLRVTGLDLAGLPPPLADQAATLNATLDLVVGTTAAEQFTTGAGLRWDALRNVAVKFQYDRLDTGAGSRGTLRNAQPGFRPGSVVNLLSLSVDFVL